MRRAADPLSQYHSASWQSSSAENQRGQYMKLHDALRKTIRHYGTSVIEDKRLMSFLADYRAFDDFPAMKDVMRCIATGDYGKKLCLAADGSDDDFLRFASELKVALVREKSFKEEFADYAIDSISFALGIPCAAAVTEPCDHGYDAVQKNTGSLGSTAAHENRPQASPAAQQTSAPRQVSRQTAFVISGDTWQTASDGAASHRRFYRGHDLTAAFDSGEFSKNVADGSFRDIFPGDYIIKKVPIPDIEAPISYSNGSFHIAGKTYTIKFIIADLDALRNNMDSRVKTHHAVIIPEEPPFDSYMNPTNRNGYASSFMNTEIMPAFAKGLAAAFGASHMLRFNADRQVCTCRLMSLHMVFGHQYFSKVYPSDDYLGGKQFAVFRLNSDLKSKHTHYWLSDDYSNAGFAYASEYVGAYCASSMDGVRPFALLT